MSRIVLTNVAKNGVEKARDYKPHRTERYKKLVDEANERIRAEKANSFNVYKKAATYSAR